MFFGLVKEEDARSTPRKAVRSILVVEDAPLVAYDKEHALAQAGYRIAATVDDHDHAVRVIDEGGVDLIVADVALQGDKNGIDVARHAAAQGLHVLFVTGRCPIDAQSLAIGCYSDRLADAGCCERRGVSTEGDAQPIACSDALHFKFWVVLEHG